ncbi:MAG: sn-glycerol-3-phosphate ABC transporter substrate-binding protein UgpB [Gemmobacter sp.]
MTRHLFATAAAAALIAPNAALAATDIHWWHAFSGRLGELLQQHADEFNAMQSDYRIVTAFKGNYSETLNAAISAFRAGEHPHILQVFEVGTASMMAARGAIKPVYEVMAEAGRPFDPASFLPAVTGYYTNANGEMLSFPYNSSTQVLYVNRNKLAEAGVDPDVDLSTWEAWDPVLQQLKDAGVACPYTTSWQSWVHLESFSAYHDKPFATLENGFGGTATELVFNGPVQVAHIGKLQEWAQDGKFIYQGRRNEAGAAFRAGDCALFTESSAGYAGVKAEAKFDFEIRHLPYWASVEGAPQNTIIGGASLWVMANHKPEEYAGVAAFFDYLTQPEVQAKWHQDTGYLPITPAAYELTKQQGFYEANPGTDIAVIQMSRNEPTENSKGLRLGSFDQIRTIIDEELEGVWAGQKTPQQALDTAVTRGNELLRRFEAANR